jgi:hypothetical protein
MARPGPRIESPPSNEPPIQSEGAGRSLETRRGLARPERTRAGAGEHTKIRRPSLPSTLERTLRRRHRSQPGGRRRAGRRANLVEPGRARASKALPQMNHPSKASSLDGRLRPDERVGGRLVEPAQTRASKALRLTTKRPVTPSVRASLQSHPAHAPQSPSTRQSAAAP